MVLEIITKLLWSSAQPAAPLPRLGLRGDLTALCFPPHNPVIASVTHIHTCAHTRTKPDSCVYAQWVCGNFPLTSAQTSDWTGSISDHMDPFIPSIILLTRHTISQMAKWNIFHSDLGRKRQRKIYCYAWFSVFVVPIADCLSSGAYMSAKTSRAVAVM